MSNTYDVIVVGLGAMGSAACHHLCKQGMRVLGLEQFSIPHGWGSSHGHSRVIRLLYHESPQYIPLLRRAYNLWHHLETESGQKLIDITGGLLMGPAKGAIISGAARAAKEHHLDYRALTAAEVRREFPQFHIPDGHHAIYDSNAGFVRPEAAIAAHALLALTRGADLRGHEPVMHWESGPHGASVTTPRGVYSAGQILFCGGAWSGTLLGELGVKLQIIRQVLIWTWPRRPELFELGRMPVWMFEENDGSEFYGFPMMAGPPGLKLAGHHYPAPASNPDVLRRGVTDEDARPVRHFLSQYMPDGDGPTLSMQPCMYTNSPDKHFIIDRHPHYPNVMLACGFSGHGFKFASAIGEALAQLATGTGTSAPIEFLRLSRFAAKG